MNLARTAEGRWNKVRLGASSLIPVLCLLAPAVVLFSAGVGAVDIEAGTILAIIAGKLGISLPWEYGPQQEAIIMNIRLPRVLLGALIGGSLSLAGAAIQGLFRNPLADPGIIGVSGGATMGAVMAIVLGGTLTAGSLSLLSALSVPFAAFIAGLVATILVYFLASKAGGTSSSTMLLAGIAVNALAAAGTGLLIYMANDAQLRNIMFWLLGSLSAADWFAVTVTTVCLVPAALLLFRSAHALDAMLLGEQQAGHLGVNVRRLKQIVVICAALVVGAATAFSGIIGFVGLIVPHVVRFLLGSRHRLVYPAAFLVGAVMLMLADVAARTIVIPAELPIGILSSLVGAPFFLFLLVGKKSPGGTVFYD